MTDIELIFLVIGGFYLGECALWIRTGSFVLCRQLGWGKHRRANLQWALLRNTDGGILLGNLLPFGQASVCQQWPLSLSPWGVYGYVAQALSPDGRPLLSERFVRYADIQIVEQRGANLHINNVFFVRAATASFAATLAELVRRLAAMPEDQRAAAIDAALARHLDAAAVNERVALFRGCAADLQISCSLLFFWVFVLAPLLVLFDSSFPLIAFLGSYIGIAFLAVQQFHHAHTFLYPHERADRWKSMLVMSFSPADLLHARDKLAHGLLAEFHPLAATAALCRPNSFQTLAAYTWRDLNYPLLPICPAPDTGPQQTEEWFRKRLQDLVERMLGEHGLDLKTALAPPPPDDRFCHTYCPRCLGQYVLSEGSCADCGGRPLERLSHTKAVAAEAT